MQQEDQFYVEPEQQQFREINHVDEPIPIFDKPRIEEPKNISLKMLQATKRQQSYSYIPFRLKMNLQQNDSQSQNESRQIMYDNPFSEYYGQDQCIYKKFHNSSFNRMKNITYFGGRFIHKSILIDSIVQEITDLQQLLKEYYEISTLPLPQPSSNDLRFDSKFQSGNLFAVFKISHNQYDLVMQNDTNSRGNNQWFYFKVQGMNTGVQYTFNVVNFTKTDSLFNYGMAPAVFSKIGYENHGQDWSRIGKDVVYKKGSIPREHSKRYYYKLSFKLMSKHANDTLEIAHSYPYTYSNLKNYINNRLSRNKDILKKIQIGKTLAKHTIYALQISLQINKKRDNRKAIIILARQHPGQTQGSYVCEGVIDKLLARNKQSQFLRKNYVFYVIPMVNPDGVIFGHYRTNLSGNDLNRKWDSTDKQLSCPEIIAIKNFIQQTSKQREIRFILDLHGHSKNFFYGNPYPQNPEAVRIYPYICSRTNPAIQFCDCTFASQQYKKKAARVYLSFYYRLIHVYTFEASFYAYIKEGKKVEFSPKQFRELGHSLVQCLFMQLEHEIKFQQSIQFTSNKLVNTKQYNSSVFVKLLNQLKMNSNLLQIGSKCESGSESHPDQMQVNINDIPIGKNITREYSTPQISQQNNQKSVNRISRKGQRQIRQIKQVNIKPTRNLKVMQISQVNSVLPDKYQLGLQPIRKKENSQLFSRNASGITKLNSECQTEVVQSLSLKDYNTKEIEDKGHLANSSRAETPTLKQRRYSSVVKTQNRNNIIFKIDLLSRESLTRINTVLIKQILKHAYSQTIISFGKDRAIQKIKPNHLFPTVESPDRQGDSKWLKPNAIRYDSTRIGMKRQAELFLNGMVKKYFAEKDMKLKDHAYSKLVERPLTIKKKQIYSIKK